MQKTAVKKHKQLNQYKTNKKTGRKSLIVFAVTFVEN